MSSALWCVMNGRAAAPPAIGCIIGVSTSRKPRSSRKRADGRDDPAARLEHSRASGVDDQVEVALAVPGLDVLQAVPLLGQRDQALGQEREARRPDREFVGLRPKQVPPTPTKSPRSSSLKSGSRDRTTSPCECRPGCACGRRSARGSSPCRNSGSRGSRPLVRVSTRAASRSSFVFPRAPPRAG